MQIHCSFFFFNLYFYKTSNWYFKLNCRSTCIFHYETQNLTTPGQAKKLGNVFCIWQLDWYKNFILLQLKLSSLIFLHLARNVKNQTSMIKNIFLKK